MNLVKTESGNLYFVHKSTSTMLPMLMMLYKDSCLIPPLSLPNSLSPTKTDRKYKRQVLPPVRNTCNLKTKTVIS